jgi:hypothetical protein
MKILPYGDDKHFLLARFVRLEKFGAGVGFGSFGGGWRKCKVLAS